MLWVLELWFEQVLSLVLVLLLELALVPQVLWLEQVLLWVLEL